MSISPSIALAVVPALRIASESIRAAVEAGADFASHMGETSGANPQKASSAPTIGKQNTRLDGLLPQLQQFLRSIGANEQETVELRTNGQGSIHVEGETGLKQAVEQWLNENPAWKEAWQVAARAFLDESPSLSLHANLRGIGSHSPHGLRSRIGPDSAEHSYLV